LPLFLIFNKETSELNCTTDEMDLINMSRTFHPKAVEHTSFSVASRIFSKTDHILGHKAILNKSRGRETTENLQTQRDSPIHFQMISGSSKK
jgi:hypothetical protein